MKAPPLLLCTLLAACCAPAGDPRLPAQLAIFSPGCLSPAAFGALPDDDVDDRAGLQAAIDAAAGGCLDLEAGTYDVSRKLELGTANIPSLRVRAPIEIKGGGQATIAMLGSGRRGNGNIGDWILLQIEAPDVVVDGVRLDGSARVDTNEQTHLLQIAGGSTGGVEIRHSSFLLPSIGPASGGDCVRLLGSSAMRIFGVQLRDLRMDECDRSAVGVQRGVFDTTIAELTSVLVGDQTIDMEPSQDVGFGCTPTIGGFYVTNSNLGRGAQQSATGLSVAGKGCAVADDVIIERSKIEGTVDLLDVGRVELRGLRLSSPAGTAPPVVQARKRVGSLRVLDCELERGPASSPAPVLQISAQNGFAPTEVVVAGTTITQRGEGPGIRAESVRELLVASSKITYSGPGADDWAITSAGTAELPAGTIDLRDVVVQGPLRGAVSAGAAFGGEVITRRLEVLP